jgi:hypothetical protein
MPKTGCISLPHWDASAYVERSTSVDTLWAPGSYLTVLRTQKMVSKIRGYVAHVGHFSLLDPRDPGKLCTKLLERYLAAARTRIRADVLVTVRGGAVLLADDDSAEDIDVLRQDKDAERQALLDALARHGYPRAALDLAWAADNEATKIIYNARTGITHVMTRDIGGIINTLPGGVPQAG